MSLCGYGGYGRESVDLVSLVGEDCSDPDVGGLQGGYHAKISTRVDSEPIWDSSGYQVGGFSSGIQWAIQDVLAAIEDNRMEVPS